ncbi:MAG: DUF1343 domain-containing protein [Gammaproteobacteria bacterium]|nr:DUF1343 domain-containing protein [Gammaproteobacteria bacterium]
MCILLENLIINRERTLRKYLLVFWLLFLPWEIWAALPIQPGAENIHQYLPLLEGKTVGVFANHTSVVNGQHLVDVLLKHHVQVVKIFAPEHGFRGDEDNKVSNCVDLKTGLPIISLYGKKLKPSAEDLEDVDILLFDIQDVGVRFYTYISSLQKFMEAAAKNNKKLIVLDRPNPNGFYVDGPVLELKHKSFTGMQPIPIVYGMTMGEYAKMLAGEQWLSLSPESKPLNLLVIPCRNYTHKSLYVPPVKPSPNLATIQAIYWYPSIGLMEATAMSVGRGTDIPFQVFGHPWLPTHFTFIPATTVCGTSPRYKNKLCHGFDLRADARTTLKKIDNKLQIKYLIEAYRLYPDHAHFFQGFCCSAGTDILEKQIKAGLSEATIRKSWAAPLKSFKKIRKKYLLYPDFE